MITQDTYDIVLYFLVFFKFVFVIIYTVNVYGLLFNTRVYNNSVKPTIIMENIFVVAMGFILLYRFSNNTIEVRMEERVLMWTLTFVMIVNGFIKLGEIDWS